jgi:hypothetical protein
MPALFTDAVDIYRTEGEPPAVLAAAAVPCYIQETYGDFLERGEHGASGRYTHRLFCGTGVDIRGDLSNCDDVYWPQYDGGTHFRCLWVEVKDGCKICYLDRQTPPWPTDYV